MDNSSFILKWYIISFITYFFNYQIELYNYLPFHLLYYKFPSKKTTPNSNPQTRSHK